MIIHVHILQEAFLFSKHFRVCFKQILTQPFPVFIKITAFNYVFIYERSNFPSVPAPALCSIFPYLSPILLSANRGEKAGLGVKFSNGKSTVGLLFADDFVSISAPPENLQKHVVHEVSSGD